MHTREQLERLIVEGLSDDDCPDPDQLAAYLLGALTPAEQLRIAAHVRRCPLCEADLLLGRPPPPKPPVRVAQLLPLLLQGVRSSAGSAPVRHYRAANLTVELTIIPTPDARWRIAGQLLREGSGVADKEVVLRRAGRVAGQRVSDPQGFFSFEALGAGRYTLAVSDVEATVQVRGIVLLADDM